MSDYDIVVIGGGPAGLAAGIAAKEAGADHVLILERDERLGGILNQCIHNGFGLHTFHEELTGPEYADRFIQRAQALGVEYQLDTMVLNLASDRKITAVNSTKGIFTIQPKAIVLAMGCRERSRGALNIPGFRPAGVFSAGTAQKLVNIDGHSIGKEVVILGSGDIGLIMARRMTLEGAHVKVVAELMPYSGGLKRNIVQCLDDYNIPLKLSHTVVRIHGKRRISGVTLAQVGPDRLPLPGTEEYYSCDTLLLSVGLLPENELSASAGVQIDPITSGPIVTDHLQTNIPGIFACGNVLHVHDLVDYVSEEAAMAGRYASEYAKQIENTMTTIEGTTSNRTTLTADTSAQKSFPGIRLQPQGAVRYTVPQLLDPEAMEESVTIRFRVGQVLRDAWVSVYLDEQRIYHKKKRIMTPGEMEQVILKKEQFQTPAGPRTLRICTEVDE